MKVKEAIELLSQMDSEFELIWDDPTEGNSCSVVTLYQHDNNIYVSPCTKAQMDIWFDFARSAKEIK